MKRDTKVTLDLLPSCTTFEAYRLEGKLTVIEGTGKWLKSLPNITYDGTI